VIGQRRNQRQENELAGGRARRQKTDHQAAARGEPPRRHRGGENDSGQPGADADHEAPQHDELPDLRHGKRREQAARDQYRRADHHAAKPKAVHESGGKRAEQSEQQEAQRQRRGDLRIVPAELAFQRNDQHAGRAHGASRHQHGQEGDANDDPAVMDITAGESGGQRG